MRKLEKLKTHCDGVIEQSGVYLSDLYCIMVLHFYLIEIVFYLMNRNRIRTI